MNKTYDIAIIGSGPGGYAASIRAAELGFKVCLIEKELIGGTCLNWGCIPTKAIIQSANFLSEIKKSRELGIDISSHSFDISRILQRKDDIVLKLRKGAESLISSKGIDIIFSRARLIGINRIETGQGIIEANNILLATGSVPLETDFLKIDHELVLSSRDILALKDLPRKLVIIGGGFIGCEFASIYNRFGVEVVIIELMEQLLPGFDKEIAKRLEISFNTNGIKVLKNEKVVSIKKQPNAMVELSGGTVIETDKALLCIGRKPNTMDLGLEKAGISMKKGAIITDEYLRTNAPNIYAIGDARGGYLLAHVASYEGMLACDNIKGISRKTDYTAVPSAVFTKPEISMVGISIDTARERGIDAELIKLPFTAVSKAHILGETDGFIKLVICKNTKKIFGGYIFGPFASELISNLTIAVKHGLTVDNVSDTIFSHPTLSESFPEAINRSKTRIPAH
jgi:dihydrolipoamide dehydrogenase